MIATAALVAACYYFKALSGLALDENGVVAVGSRESFLDLVVLAFTSLPVPFPPYEAQPPIFPKLFCYMYG
jgi:hypothetical protein